MGVGGFVGLALLTGDNWAGLAGLMIGVPVGMVVGGSLGVWLAGRAHDTSASFLATLLGATLGAAAGFLGVVYTGKPAYALAGIALSTAGAIAGYELTVGPVAPPISSSGGRGAMAYGAKLSGTF